MINICNEIHQLCSKLPRYKYKFNILDLPKNGIYIVFEKSEHAHNTDRIVRIGTHIGQDNLPVRLQEHFYNENKNRSIFRKNIGRAFLQNDKYLEIWNMDFFPKINRKQYANKINPKKQADIENQVSDFIRKNVSFVILPIENEKQRLEFEAKIIGTVSLCKECAPSKKWLGLSSPEEKIRCSGLWQKQYLYKTPLDEVDLKKFKIIVDKI